MFKTKYMIETKKKDDKPREPILTIEQFIQVSSTQKQIKQMKDICGNIQIEFKKIADKVQKLTDLPLKTNSKRYCADFEKLSDKIDLFKMQTSCSYQVTRMYVNPLYLLKSEAKHHLKDLHVHCRAAIEHFTRLSPKFNENCDVISRNLEETKQLDLINQF